MRLTRSFFLLLSSVLAVFCGTEDSSTVVELGQVLTPDEADSLIEKYTNNSYSSRNEQEKDEVKDVVLESMIGKGNGTLDKEPQIDNSTSEGFTSDRLRGVRVSTAEPKKTHNESDVGTLTIAPEMPSKALYHRKNVEVKPEFKEQTRTLELNEVPPKSDVADTVNETVVGLDKAVVLAENSTNLSMLDEIEEVGVSFSESVNNFFQSKRNGVVEMTEKNPKVIIIIVGCASAIVTLSLACICLCVRNRLKRRSRRIQLAGLENDLFNNTGCAKNRAVNTNGETTLPLIPVGHDNSIA